MYAINYCWVEARARLEAFKEKYNELMADMNIEQPKMKIKEEGTNTQNMQQVPRQIRA